MLPPRPPTRSPSSSSKSSSPSKIDFNFNDTRSAYSGTTSKGGRKLKEVIRVRRYNYEGGVAAGTGRKLDFNETQDRAMKWERRRNRGRKVFRRDGGGAYSDGESIISKARSNYTSVSRSKSRGPRARGRVRGRTLDRDQNRGQSRSVTRSKSRNGSENEGYHSLLDSIGNKLRVSRSISRDRRRDRSRYGSEDDNRSTFTSMSRYGRSKGKRSEDLVRRTPNTSFQTFGIDRSKLGTPKKEEKEEKRGWFGLKPRERRESDGIF